MGVRISAKPQHDATQRRELLTSAAFPAGGLKIGGWRCSWTYIERHESRLGYQDGKLVSPLPRTAPNLDDGGCGDRANYCAKAYGLFWPHDGEVTATGSARSAEPVGGIRAAAPLVLKRVN